MSLLAPLLLTAGCNAILGNDHDVHATGAGGASSSNGSTTSSSSASTSSHSASSTSTSSASTAASSSSGAGGASSSSTSSSSSGASSSSSSGAGGCNPTSGAVLAPSLGLPTPFVPLADGMQCGSAAIDQVDGRIGGWSTTNDGTMGATQTPAAGQTYVMTLLSQSPMMPDYLKGVSYAARTFGHGFTQWGAIQGVNFTNVGPYDATAYGYKGVAFLARSASPMQVSFQVQDKYSWVPAGICDNSPNSMNPCNDTPRIDIALTPTWKAFAFTWSQLKAGGWGSHNPAGHVDETALYMEQWVVPANVDFDFEVTEVGFFQ